MGAPTLFAVDENESPALLRFRSRAPEATRAARDGVRELRFEYSSRGDRVPGRLLLPAGAERAAPLVLALHGTGLSKDDEKMDLACAPGARAGAAVAAIDLPLHGERASPKLSERVLAVAEGRRRPGAHDKLLWIEFVRQTVCDLRRAVVALSEQPEVDGERIGFAGFSLGSILGTPFCAEEPRVRAAALAVGGGGLGPVAVDPLGHVGRIAPRPLLFVNARHDEHVSREAAEALHEAAGQPKEVLWFESGHADLPGVALRAMWRFLAEHLGLD